MNWQEQGRFFAGCRPLQAGTVFLCLAVLAALVFVCRRPVILVSDRPFEQLYGENRARWKRLGLSVRLFRPVKTVLAAEEAGSDLIAQAVLYRSRRPRALFFPWRYREAARRCLGERPGTAVVVLGGRNLPTAGEVAAETGVFWWFCTDTALDSLRAQAMAELAGGKIALGRDDLGEKDNVPLILFTWADPVLLPRNVLAVFDDSPLAQLKPAMDVLGQGRTGNAGADPQLISSEISVFRWNKEIKVNYNEINVLKRLKNEGKNTDN